MKIINLKIKIKLN